MGEVPANSHQRRLPKYKEEKVTLDTHNYESGTPKEHENCRNM
jgi:hypothetical protein